MVSISGAVEVSSGVGAIYAGALNLSGANFDVSLVYEPTGSDPTTIADPNQIHVFDYAAWTGLSANDLFLSGGSGSGGEGGYGQVPDAAPTLGLLGLGLLALGLFRRNWSMTTISI
jgi:hypothetical protein